MPRKLLLALGGLIIALILIAALLPGVLIKRAFNRTFTDPDSLVAKVSAEKVSTSLFLDEVTVSNMSLTPRQGQTSPITVAEVKANNLSAVAVLRTILGIRGDAFDLFSDSEVVVRDINVADDPQSLVRVHVGTLSMDGFTQNYAIQNPDRLDHISFKSLKYTDLRIIVGADLLTLSSEGLSFFDLRNSILGGFSVAALEINSPLGPRFQTARLNNAALSNLDLIKFQAAASKIVQAENAAEARMALPQLRDSFGSLDLSSLSLTGANAEVLFLRKLLMEGQDGGGEAGQGSVTSVEELAVDMAAMAPDFSGDPVAQAVVDALGPRPVFDYRVTSGFRDGRLTQAASLTVRDALDFRMGFSLDNAPSNLNMMSLALSLPKLALNPGEIVITDHSFLPRLSQALSRRAFDGAPAQAYLAPRVEAFLASLVDPNPGSAPLNKEILQIELNQFLTNPQSLRLSFEPIPGYPAAVAQGKDAGGAGLLGLLASPDGTKVLAEKYKYAMLRELNLTLEVNGRAPVSVYLKDTATPLPVNPVDTVGPADPAGLPNQ
ncbi:MAG: hypothetical protein LBF58_04385 [Deltaproteobacteria bacterium]|jgi:hypothetical protein|nr:hypothetical protein [Deltaproteobacteria bacterium]